VNATTYAWHSMKQALGWCEINEIAPDCFRHWYKENVPVDWLSLLAALTCKVGFMSQNSVKFSIDYKYFFRISKMRFKIMPHLLKYLQCTGFDLLLKLKRTLIFFIERRPFVWKITWKLKVYTTTGGKCISTRIKKLIETN